MQQLISLVGFKGSGKDTLAKHLIDNHGYVGFSFADSLKDAVASMFCWDRAMLVGDTVESREWRETVDPWWAEHLGIPNFTPRLAMQLVGTDAIRDHFHADLWVLNIKRKLTLMGNAKVVLIDGRFPNEINLGRSFGATVIRVQRGEEPSWYQTAKLANEGCEASRAELEDGPHESEWAWIGQPLDHVITNNGTIEEMLQEGERLCGITA